MSVERTGEPEADRGRFPAITAIALVPVLFVSYVLSPVPVMLAIMHVVPANAQESAMAVFVVIYAPLQWAYEHSESVERFYDWYGSLFGLP